MNSQLPIADGAERLPRHEIWRRKYRLNRYCRHLSQPELNQRIRDIFLLQISLEPNAKIGMYSPERDGGRTIELWTHVLEEMTLRFGPYPAGFTREILHNEPFPDFAGRLAARASSALEHLRKSSVGIKFGKPSHMRNLYDKGVLRIQSASYYKRPAHNGAVRDDELALEISLAISPNEITRLVRNPEDVPINAFSHRIDVNFEARSDYWLYCLTTNVDPRMFVDFEAEACVVIKDLPRFTAAIKNAAGSSTAGAEFRSRQITYVDPILPKVAFVDLPMSKHFRYSYQNEYRIVWVPNSPRWDLGHFDIEIGRLNEYAELIVI